MSSVFIHIGQCGNQLSVPLWNNFKSCNDNKDTEQVFTSLDGYHRSIHIDGEPKVVKDLPKTMKVRDKNIIVGKRGRGANFALGYHGMTSAGDDHILDKSLEAIRKEIEKCDSYSGAVVVHSLSGGTGSGLGSRIIENIRDNYPCNYIKSCCVAPCASGESPLQSYNALLTLHWLQTYCDSIIILQNDLLVSRASRVKKDGTTPQVSFNDINKIAANTLSGLFLPTDTLQTSRGISLGQEPWELVRTLTPMPALKFIHTAQYSSQKLSWDILTSKALLQCPRYNSYGGMNSGISATVVARKDTTGSFMPSVKHGLDKKLRKGLNLVGWNPYPLDCWTTKTGIRGIPNSASVTVAVNSSCINDLLSLVLERSLAKLNVGAYTHWYHRYGVSEDVFEESIETLRSTRQEYEAAAL